MWVSDTSIKQPVFVTMLIAAIIVLGIVSYGRLGVDLFPDINFPMVVVTTAYPGAGPEDVENLVSKPIEEAVSVLNGVKTVSSTSQEGFSAVVIQFDLGTQVKFAAMDVRDKVSAIRNDLPKDIYEPVISKLDFNATPVISYGVTDKTGKMNDVDLRYFVDDKLVPIVERVTGVAQVSVVGGKEREIQVNRSCRNDAIGHVRDRVAQHAAHCACYRVVQGDHSIRRIGGIQCCLKLRPIGLRNALLLDQVDNFNETDRRYENRISAGNRCCHPFASHARQAR